jgi:hypothetical protein
MLRLFGATAGDHWRVDCGGVAGMIEAEQPIPFNQLVDSFTDTLVGNGHANTIRRGPPVTTVRWDVDWGRTPRQIADDYIANGEARRRKDGKWDMRYRASRFVDRVKTGKVGFWA